MKDRNTSPSTQVQGAAAERAALRTHLRSVKEGECDAIALITQKGLYPDDYKVFTAKIAEDLSEEFTGQFALGIRKFESDPEVQDIMEHYKSFAVEVAMAYLEQCDLAHYAYDDAYAARNDSSNAYFNVGADYHRFISQGIDGVVMEEAENSLKRSIRLAEENDTKARKDFDIVEISTELSSGLITKRAMEWMQSPDRGDWKLSNEQAYTLLYKIVGNMLRTHSNVLQRDGFVYPDIGKDSQPDSALEYIRQYSTDKSAKLERVAHGVGTSL